MTDYSDFERRPWDRLLRTMDYVRLLVYGGDAAVAAGRRLRGLDKRFRGTRADGTHYSALEPCTYFRRTACTQLERTASLERVLSVIDHVSAPPAPISGLLWPLLRIPPGGQSGSAASGCSSRRSAGAWTSVGRRSMRFSTARSASP